MRCRRRGGRKRIVRPAGSELAPATKPQHDGTQDARPRPGAGRSCSMRAGYTPVSEIAEAEGIAKSYISEPGGAARASRL